jgi:hypothetical protein
MSTNANNHIQAKHQQAMLLAQDALVAIEHGQHQSAVKLYEGAFELEKDAALELHKIGTEPLRSVLFRSAASLAMQAEQLREAERMIAFGLTGNPPEEIVGELRAINRHLSRLLREEPEAEPAFVASPNGVSHRVANNGEATAEEVQIIYGTLTVADVDKKQIKIAEANQQYAYNKVKVPNDLVGIVQQFFGQLVRATVTRTQGKSSYVLIAIERT